MAMGWLPLWVLVIGISTIQSQMPMVEQLTTETEHTLAGTVVVETETQHHGVSVTEDNKIDATADNIVTDNGISTPSLPKLTTQIREEEINETSAPSLPTLTTYSFVKEKTTQIPDEEKTETITPFPTKHTTQIIEEEITDPSRSETTKQTSPIPDDKITESFAPSQTKHTTEIDDGEKTDTFAPWRTKHTTQIEEGENTETVAAWQTKYTTQIDEGENTETVAPSQTKHTTQSDEVENTETVAPSQTKHTTQPDEVEKTEIVAPTQTKHTTQSDEVENTETVAQSQTKYTTQPDEGENTETLPSWQTKYTTQINEAENTETGAPSQTKHTTQPDEVEKTETVAPSQTKYTTQPDEGEKTETVPSWQTKHTTHIGEGDNTETVAPLQTKHTTQPDEGEKTETVAPSQTKHITQTVEGLKTETAPLWQTKHTTQTIEGVKTETVPLWQTKHTTQIDEGENTETVALSQTKLTTQPDDGEKTETVPPRQTKYTTQIDEAENTETVASSQTKHTTPTDEGEITETVEPLQTKHTTQPDGGEKTDTFVPSQTQHTTHVGEGEITETFAPSQTKHTSQIPWEKTTESFTQSTTKHTTHIFEEEITFTTKDVIGTSDVTRAEDYTTYKSPFTTLPFDFTSEKLPIRTTQESQTFTTNAESTKIEMTKEDATIIQDTTERESETISIVTSVPEALDSTIDNQRTTIVEQSSTASEKSTAEDYTTYKSEFTTLPFDFTSEELPIQTTQDSQTFTTNAESTKVEMTEEDATIKQDTTERESETISIVTTVPEAIDSTIDKQRTTIVEQSSIASEKSTEEDYTTYKSPFTTLLFDFTSDELAIRTTKDSQTFTANAETTKIEMTEKESTIKQYTTEGESETTVSIVTTVPEVLDTTLDDQRTTIVKQSSTASEKSTAPHIPDITTQDTITTHTPTPTTPTTTTQLPETTTVHPCASCQNGRCEHNQCVCFPFYVGTDCETALDINVTVTNTQTGHVIDGDKTAFICNVTLLTSNVKIEILPKWKVGQTTITNNKNPSLRFYYTSMVIDETTSSSDLTINPAVSRDSGSVTCFATTAASGSATNFSDSTQLIVSSRPSSRITPIKRSTTNLANFEIKFSCIIQNETNHKGNATEFRWYDVGGCNYYINSTYSASNVTVTRIPDGQPGDRKECRFMCQSFWNSGTGSENLPDIGSDNVTATLTILYFEDTVEICSCKANESRGLPETVEGYEATVPCGENQEGNKTVICINGCTWGPMDTTNCVDRDYFDTVIKIDDVISSGTTSDDATRVLEDLDKLVSTDVDSDEGIAPGNIKASVDAVNTLSQAREEATDEPVTEDELKTVISVTGTLLDDNNVDAWDDINKFEEESGSSSSTVVLQTIDTYTGARVKTMDPDTEEVIPDNNLGVHLKSMNRAKVSQSSQGSISMCDRDSFMSKNITFTNTNDSIVIQDETLAGFGVNISMSCVIYRTMHNIIPAKSLYLSDNGTHRIFSDHAKMTSLTFAGGPVNKIQPPIQLSFSYINETTLNVTDEFIYEPVCVFWNESVTEWETYGCSIDTANSNQWRTTCKCNHTTNFGIIMRPVNRPYDPVLSIISLIGCIISLLGLFITLGVYAVFWKSVKSYHAVLLVNLCAVLILAYVLFLLGIYITMNQDLCITVAAFLHYLFMVAMFIMLAEGIQLYVFLVHVFRTKRYKETFMLLAASYSIPAVIVGITIGVIGPTEYISEYHCWLNIDRAIYAFIGPVAVIMAVNFIVLIIVLRKAYRGTTKALITKKTRAEKVVNVIRNMAILTPLLGTTWILGLFLFDSIAMEYIFTILTSLQGVFIFLFHCVLNKKMRDAVHSSYSTKSTGDTSKKYQAGSGKSTNSTSGALTTESDTNNMTSNASLHSGDDNTQQCDEEFTIKQTDINIEMTKAMSKMYAGTSKAPIDNTSQKNTFGTNDNLAFDEPDIDYSDELTKVMSKMYAGSSETPIENTSQKNTFGTNDNLAFDEPDIDYSDESNVDNSDTSYV